MGVAVCRVDAYMWDILVCEIDNCIFHEAVKDLGTRAEGVSEACGVSLEEGLRVMPKMVVD